MRVGLWVCRERERLGTLQKHDPQFVPSSPAVRWKAGYKAGPPGDSFSLPEAGEPPVLPALSDRLGAVAGMLVGQGDPGSKLTTPTLHPAAP